MAGKRKVRAKIGGTKMVCTTFGRKGHKRAICAQGGKASSKRRRRRRRR